MSCKGNFHSKVKVLSNHLSIWSKKKKPLQTQLQDVEANILKFQSAPNRHLLLHDEKKLARLHDDLMSKLSDFYKQRAKKHWIQQGDRNTSFFRRAVLQRKRKNRIVGIMSNSGWTNNPDEISDTFISYFKNLFTSDNSQVMQEIFSRGSNSFLPQEMPDPPSKDQIWDILKEMKTDASPGPDGLNVGFYKSAWPWIKKDITEMVKEFFLTGSLQAGMNDTNITLIPKKNNPICPADFRPISLCNVSYKIISKVLANHIKLFLPELISHSQQAFIKGRKISNNLIIAQEIVHSFSLDSFKSDAFMLKLDLAKAFDSLEWDFIALALRRQGFHGNFIDLVLSCINSASFSVNLNGQSFGHFSAQRGIRQGCPLSPYLFVTAINDLSEMLSQGINSGLISGTSLTSNGPILHSLMYADDLIIVGQANSTEANNIFHIIDSFCKASGQAVNWNKSSILFSSHTASDIKQNILRIFPVYLMDSTTKYLGHPLIMNTRARSPAYNFIIAKFKSKLTWIKARTLFHAGRLALIKSQCLLPFPSITCLLFYTPKLFFQSLLLLLENFGGLVIKMMKV